MNVADFDGAIVAHRAWVARFRSALSGLSTEKLDPALASDSSACALGRWLLHDASRAISADLYAQIVLLHQKFHFLAGEIVIVLANFVEKSTVEVQVANLDALSKELISLLLLAKKSVGSTDMPV